MQIEWDPDPELDAQANEGGDDDSGDSENSIHGELTSLETNLKAIQSLYNNNSIMNSPLPINSAVDPAIPQFPSPEHTIKRHLHAREQSTLVGTKKSILRCISR
jgi:hypothetical protein